MFGQRKKEFVLRVEDPDPSHVGRNIITLDKRTKELLGLTSGDLIEIEGSKKTAAVIWPARAEDEGKAIIRMDNLIRNNSGIVLGEKVTIRKAIFVEAKRVVLAPTQEVRIIASGYDRILKKNFIGRPLNKGDHVWISVFGSGFVYKVVDTVPKGIVKINDFTQFILKEEPVKEDISSLQKIAYEDIGGLEEQIRKIREMIELPMRHPEIFRKLGINPPKGVLLHGSPGTGKTLLAKAVATETQAHFISINSPSIMSKFVGEAEERIRDVFKEAEKNAPSIIFFDEIDSIAPKRDEVIGEVERRVVAQILSAMDGMEARGDVIVIAATNRINSIDEALRRPGRFDREIDIGVPTKSGRHKILQIHTRGMPIAPPIEISSFNAALEKIKKDVINAKRKEELILEYKKIQTQDRKKFIQDLSSKESNEINTQLMENFLDELSAQLHGFVGADLESLAKEAAMKALRRYLPKIDLEEETIPVEILEKLEVNKRDFMDALKEVQPSALREVTIEVPNVKWSDIGGIEKVKKELKQAVEWPLKHPEQFKKMGITPPRGILLYGPPGTGKTLLAKAVATESDANFISVKGPQLISMWVGETEKAVRRVFKRARQVSPVIVFFDELDAMAASRGSHNDSGSGERMVNQLLTELDGIEELKDVVFIAATNRPDMIDPALLRPGRIDKMIKINAPKEDGRLSILKVQSKKMKFASDVSLEDLAKKTEGYTGADIEGLLKEAALISLERNKMKAESITKDDFEEALKKVKPTITKETVESYEQFKESQGIANPSYVR